MLKLFQIKFETEQSASGSFKTNKMQLRPRLNDHLEPFGAENEQKMNSMSNFLEIKSPKAPERLGFCVALRFRRMFSQSE